MSGKIVSAAEAVAGFIPDGSTVAVGGMHLHNNPMALVFEIVRQRRRAGRLVTSPSASLNADVLIGAGLVTEVVTSYVGFEHLGLAPCFRRGCERGTLRVLDIDEGSLTHALHAGASGMPFAALPRGLELADVWRSDDDLYRMVEDPFSGEQFLAVLALRPDVAIVHAAAADERGTAWLRGAEFTDRLMALAAKHVVVQVERVISRDETSRMPAGTTIPGFLVDAVVEAPGGCAPTASHGAYPYEEADVKEYLRMARTEEGFAEWVSRKQPKLAEVARP